MDEFEKWLEDIGKLQKICSLGKTYMVNPKAMKTLMDISDFFKRKSNEYVTKFNKLGIKVEPYTIEIVSSDPAFKKNVTLRISTNDSNEIDFSSRDIEILHNLLKESVTLSIMGQAEPERFQIWFIIDDYFIEVKPH